MATPPQSNPPIKQECPPPKKPIRWGRRLLVVAILCLVGWLFHGTLLRGMAQLLVKSDPLPEEPYAVLVFTMPSSPRNFQEAARVAGPKQPVLLLRGKKTRLMKMGLEKQWSELEQQELTKLGIENFAILEDKENRYFYQFCKKISDWLTENQDKKIVFVHNKSSGLSFYRILNRHLDSDHLKRIHFYPLDDPEFDFNQWYLKKEGQAAMIQSFGGLLFDFFVGDGQLPGPDWDEKAYEESLP